MNVYIGVIVVDNDDSSTVCQLLGIHIGKLLVGRAQCPGRRPLLVDGLDRFLGVEWLLLLLYSDLI